MERTTTHRWQEEHELKEEEKKTNEMENESKTKVSVFHYR